MLLDPGELFDDSLDSPTRDGVYRVVAVRTRTVLADNVAGLRRSFDKRHLVRRADRELWDRLAASPPSGVHAPASAPTARPEPHGKTA
jgi:hypothetical protein